jgi:hypothetical protein
MSGAWPYSIDPYAALLDDTTPPLIVSVFTHQNDGKNCILVNAQQYALVHKNQSFFLRGYVSLLLWENQSLGMCLLLTILLTFGLRLCQVGRIRII